MKIKKEFIEQEVLDIGFKKIPIGFTERSGIRKEIYKDKLEMYRRITPLSKYLENNKKNKENRSDETECPNCILLGQNKSNKTKNLDLEGIREGGIFPASKSFYGGPTPHSELTQCLTSECNPDVDDEFSGVYSLPELSSFDGVPLLENLKNDNYERFNIAFDSEWVTLPEKFRRVLSCQFAVVFGGKLFEYIVLDVSDVDEDNLFNLDIILQKIIGDCGVTPFRDSKDKKKFKACTGFKSSGVPVYEIFESYKALSENRDTIYPLRKNKKTGVYEPMIETVGQLIGSSKSQKRFKEEVDDEGNSYLIDLFEACDDGDVKNLRDWVWATRVSHFSDKERLSVTLLCHFGRSDISTLEGFSSKYLKYCIEVQKGVVSAHPMRFEVVDRSFYKSSSSQRYVHPIMLSIRDTMSLAPEGGRSLANLGDIVGLSKLTVCKNCKSRMDKLLNENPRLFFEYSSRDSVVTLLYSATIFGYNAPLPKTFTSLCSRALYEYITEGDGSTSELGELILKDAPEVDYSASTKEVRKAEYFRKQYIKSAFDKHYRGLSVTSRGLTERDGNLYLDSSLEPINPYTNKVINLATQSYYGGLNACYKVGYFTAQDITKPIDFSLKPDGLKYHSYDFDVLNCYPTAMVLVDDWDTENPIKQDISNQYINLNHFKNDKGEIDPTTYLFGAVAFEHPKDTYLPAIPQSDDGRLTFVLKAGDPDDPLNSTGAVYASGPEILRALQLGAKVYCYEGVILNKREGNILRDFSISAIKSRDIAKAKYGDDSLQEILTKLYINALYGKICQGISIKKTFDAYNDIMHELGHSTVTCPVRGAMITGLVRACLNSVMTAVRELGYTCYSVTTDGFISDIPEDELLNLQYEYFGEAFAKSRKLISGIPLLWKQKHANPDLYNITTRGNMSSYVKGVMAKNGVKIPEDLEYKKQSPEERRWFFDQVATRDGRILSVSKTFTSFKELARSDINEIRGKTTSKGRFRDLTVNVNLKMDFDFKRKPDFNSLEIVKGSFIDGNGVIKNFELCNFDTKPYNDIDEARKYHSLASKKDCIKTKDDFIEFDHYIKGYREGVSSPKKGKSLAMQYLSHFIRYFRNGLYDIPLLRVLGFNENTSIELVNFMANTDDVDLYKGDKFKRSDWGNAKRNRGSIVHMDALKDYQKLFDSSRYSLTIVKEDDDSKITGLEYRIHKFILIDKEDINKKLEMNFKKTMGVSSATLKSLELLGVKDFEIIDIEKELGSIA